MLVKDLKPRSGFDELSGEIVSVSESRSFANERGSGKVASAVLKDNKGKEVKLSLWNDEIDKVKEGSKVKITNGWCSEWQGQIQVSAGRNGTLEVEE
ncbi:MAG: replication factor A1 [archaeon GW2011_AR10]|nr:MAG: replication factor A1 [archaeon GW2011_AR10]